jgi:hypothetical protein
MASGREARSKFNFGYNETDYGGSATLIRRAKIFIC